MINTMAMPMTIIAMFITFRLDALGRCCYLVVGLDWLVRLAQPELAVLLHGRA